MNNPHGSARALIKNNGSVAEHFLDMACKNLRVVDRAIKEYGDDSIAAYLQHLLTKKTATSYQPRDDLIKAVYRYVAPLLGESIAQRASRDLDISPVVLTANHHGVDYFSHSLQGSLIFSIYAKSGGASTSTVPIFSCGNVPLDNATYPRGLLFYNATHAALGAMPKKLPVFPNRLRRCLVSAAPAFDESMIERAEKRIDKMVSDKEVSSSLAGFMHEILQKDYGAGSVTDLPNYSQQSVVLNNRIWKRFFSNADSTSDMIYLELEKIVSILLESDLSNPQSLGWCLMFDPALREHLLEELDGDRACWRREKLVQRLRIDSLDEIQKKTLDSCGTLFFWGINNAGRRIPLYLETGSSSGDILRGLDDKGKIWEIPYTPASIISALQENRLIPSLFTCYLTISFARGIACAGGYFQAEYLPAMQQGVVTALQKTPGYHDAAHLVAKVPTDSYLSGMLTVMTRIKDGGLIPAGPLEIIAGGRLTGDDFEKMLSISVRNAHLAALFEIVPDAVPREFCQNGWKNRLAADCARLLADKVLVK